MFTNVSAFGNWRLTARIASVAGVSPWAHMNKIFLFSLYNDDWKVDACVATNLAARSNKRITRAIDRFVERCEMG